MYFRFFISGYKTSPPLTLSFNSCIRVLFWPLCGRHKSNYLVVLYLVCKLLYIANAIGQLFLLNVLLDTDFHSYGIDVIQKSLAGDDWFPTTRFPRVTMCDFKVRRLGNAIHRYVVQCALPINLFNERLYLIIWFWFVIVAAATCYSFLEWLFRATSRMDNHRYIKKHLQLSHKIDPSEDKQLMIRFTDKYLGPDGCMILKLISKNTDAYTVVDIVGSLWDNYKKEVAPMYNSVGDFKMNKYDD